jgi:DNA repair protein RadC
MSKYAGVQILRPQDLAGILSAYTKKRQEHFLVITLNGAHRIIKVHVVSKGLANRAVVHPREVFYPAIVDNAVAIMVAHNHPSNSIVPSTEDNALTKDLKNAGELLGIQVLDHIIITRDSYYSYKQNSDIFSSVIQDGNFNTHKS